MTLNLLGETTGPLSCNVSFLSLTGMNAAVRRLDQIIHIFAPLSVGQVMTWASHVIGCGFILGWNLVSLLEEFLFLSRVYQLVPQLAVKPQQQAGGHFLERQQEAVNIQGNANSEMAFVLLFLLSVSVLISSF